MTKIYCNDTPEAMAEIRATLDRGEAVEVCNSNEDGYYEGFGEWLREGLADTGADVIDAGRCQWRYGYIIGYTVIPKRAGRRAKRA